TSFFAFACVCLHRSLLHRRSRFAFREFLHPENWSQCPHCPIGICLNAGDVEEKNESLNPQQNRVDSGSDSAKGAAVQKELRRRKGRIRSLLIKRTATITSA